MGDTSPTPHQLLVEAVVFWSIGFVIYVGRIIARCISNGGIRHLQVDDYIMTATFAVYTTLLVLIRVSAEYATNLFPESDRESILADPQDVANRIYGSKIVIGLEQCMLISTWGVKTCLVAMYWKLTARLPWHLFVQVLAGYVALGFVVIEITYFAVYCRPFSQYWAVPVDNPQCATYQHYSITQAVFNLSSDAWMLAIPIPLLRGTQMPIKKKILLISVLGLGVFVMVAAILNKYFNFASPDTTIYQLWYIREASTAIYVANLMCWWPLLRKIFGKALSQYSGNYRTTRYGDPSHRSGGASQQLGSVVGAGASAKGTQTSVVGKGKGSKKRWWTGGASHSRSESKVLVTSASQEAINNSSSSGRESQNDVPLEIWRKVEYNVEQNPDPKP
ncbi:hypothetical protein BJX63DRAFT_133981 [Aspergillus granulosus]|uniref:Rhodopsin domain-containing protein n=1 Tax=Aspergillus granulosus TaxID=176169 RepID=A0ABR4GT92_9EURO